MSHAPRQAADAIWAHLREHETPPVAILQTGRDRLQTVAELCRDAWGWQRRTLVIVPDDHKPVLEVLAHPNGSCGVWVDNISTLAATARMGTVDLIILDSADTIAASMERHYYDVIHRCRQMGHVVKVCGVACATYRICGKPTADTEYLLEHVCFNDQPELIPGTIAHNVASAFNATTVKSWVQHCREHGIREDEIPF